VNRIPAPEDAGQEKDLLLNVGSKAKEACDLAQTCAADVSQPGQLGVVGDLTRANQLVEAHGQGHEASVIWRLQAFAEGDLSERARRRAAELAQGWATKPGWSSDCTRWRRATT
jgi:hypothetical protein